MFRLLFWLILAPFRLIGWVIRRSRLALVGYSVVRLRVEGTLPDRRGPGSLLAFLGRDERGPALLDLLVVLDRARRDPRIEAVWVEIGSLRTSLARAEELADSMAAVGRAGKRVIVSLEEAGLSEYRAALGANEIVLAPSGALNIVGLSTEVVFLKGLLDKVGIRGWFAARGEYKTARELFAEPSMTPENREMTESLVGDLYEQLVSAIADNRKLPEETVRSRIDEGPFLAEAAMAGGLVDELAYADEVETRLSERFGRRKILSASRYLRLSAHVARGRPTTIALLEVKGHIKSGRTVPAADGPRATGSRTFVREVERIAKDPRVRAAVLRVDSPGGSALASDLMWHALCRLAKEKPLVVSMSGVAASGGYFVSGIKGVPIFALGTTLTGSIGVLGGKFDARGLYDFLGVKKEIVQRGRRATYWSDYTKMSDDELRKLDEDIEAHYRQFVTKMADGRGLSYSELDSVARGRVWTGRQALERALADSRGGLLQAFAKVRELLELPESSPLAVATGPAERRRFPIRLEWRLPEALSEALGAHTSIASSLGRDRVFALLPFDIRFR